MPVWKTQPIDVEPQLVLHDWQIVEIDGGSRHFVGYRRGLCEGRVWSDIVEFDREKQTGVTASGRVYRLEGPPLPGGRFKDDADYVWGVWVRREGVKFYEVVTERALRGE